MSLENHLISKLPRATYFIIMPCILIVMSVFGQNLLNKRNIMALDFELWSKNAASPRRTFEVVCKLRMGIEPTPVNYYV